MERALQSQENAGKLRLIYQKELELKKAKAEIRIQDKLLRKR